MKKDLSHLLKAQSPEGFEDLESAREYIARYLLSYINIELEGLPREEWRRTIETWLRMIAFVKGMLRKSEIQRREIYRRFNFDPMLEGVLEDIHRTLLGLISLGVIEGREDPRTILTRIVDLIKDRKDLISRWDLSEEILRFISSTLQEE